MCRSRAGTVFAALGNECVALVAITASVSGCGLFSTLPFLDGLGSAPGKVEVVSKRRGCSEFSHSAVLTANSPGQLAAIQWFFTDGTVQVGQSIVHTFDKSGQQRVRLVIGAEVQDFTLEIPVRGEPDGGPDPFGDTCRQIEGEQHVPQGSTVNYRDNPPASGPHYSGAGVAPIAPGFYPDPVPPEVWVHNLEHGDVVILFDCPGTCDLAFLQTLQGFFNSIVSHKLVVTRYPGLPSPIMAVAWQVQRSFNEFDAVELKAFHDRRVGQAPEGEE